MVRDFDWIELFFCATFRSYIHNKTWKWNIGSSRLCTSSHVNEPHPKPVDLDDFASYGLMYCSPCMLQSLTNIIERNKLIIAFSQSGGDMFTF